MPAPENPVAELRAASLDAVRDVVIANTETRADPLAAVRCGGVDDVRRVVGLAASWEVPLAIRGGGYSAGGFGTLDGGLVLDVSKMTGVVVDPSTRRVRVGAGTTTGAVEEALAPHGLALTLPVPNRIGLVGAALLGGVGVFVRKLGYVSDAVVGATVVTGTAETRRFDRGDEELWALKGGGGNFGVVTELELEAAPIPRAVVHQVVIGQEAIADALQWYDGWSAGLPDDVTAVAMLRAIPPLPDVPADRVGRPGMLLTVIHADPARAETDLARLAAAPGVLVSSARAATPLELRMSMERGFPAERFGAIIRSGWGAQLTEPGIAALTELAGRMPSTASAIEVVRMGGAIPGIADAGSAPGRHADYLLNAMALWTDDAEAEGCRAWAEHGREVIHAVRDGDALVPGFISEDEAGMARETYGDDYARLAAVKGRLDPANLFRRNLVVEPVLR
jgi:FAD/FMN-containing dehydrogenase